jgi:hypothetical protein
MEAALKVEIERWEHRFILYCDFDWSMVKFFKKIPGRYYDVKLKTWSFANASLEPILHYLMLRNIPVHETVQNVIVWRTDDKLMVKFNAWFDDRDALFSIKGIEYDSESRLFYVPYEQEESFDLFLATQKLSVMKRDLRIQDHPQQVLTQPKIEN